MFYDKATFRILGEDPSKVLESSSDNDVRRNPNDNLEEYVVIPFSNDPSFMDDPKQAYLLKLLAARDALRHHDIKKATMHLGSAIQLETEGQVEKGPYGKKIKP